MGKIKPSAGEWFAQGHTGYYVEEIEPELRSLDTWFNAFSMTYIWTISVIFKFLLSLEACSSSLSFYLCSEILITCNAVCLVNRVELKELSILMPPNKSFYYIHTDFVKVDFGFAQAFCNPSVSRGQCGLKKLCFTLCLVNI